MCCFVSGEGKERRGEEGRRKREKEDTLIRKGIAWKGKGV